MSWRDAIARVQVNRSGQEIRSGTAFLVSEDLVLTALHVVADCEVTPVQWRGDIVLSFGESATNVATTNHQTVATPLTDRLNPDEDWVVLRCTKPPPGIKALPLVPVAEDGAGWKTFGFPKARSTDGHDLAGLIRNRAGTVKGVRALQLYSDDMAAGGLSPKGFSGSPVMMSRAAPGAPNSLEDVVVGIIRWAPEDAYQNVDAGALFACPMGPVLANCADILQNYDSFLRRVVRWSRRAVPRLKHAIWNVFLSASPWLLAVLFFFVLPVVILYWPEEWTIRSTFNNPGPICKVDFATCAFDRPTFSGITDHDTQAQLMLKMWKTWTRESCTENPECLVVKMEKPFGASFFSFDREVHVSYKHGSKLENARATVLAGAAFLVKESAFVNRGVALPRYRQQLLFVDVGEEENTKKRECVLHFHAPNRDENLLLILRIVGEHPLPADPSQFEVTLVPWKGKQ